jgi:5-phospho-D-xylono-1,4-lactonase
MSVVRTVLGDVSTTDLGTVYAHEHLVLDSPLIAAAFPHILLDDVEAAVAEVSACRAAGVTTLVDAMPCSAGRDVLRLAEIAQRTGTHIVAATGLHHERYYGPRHWTGRLTAEELANLFVADLVTGVDAFDYTGPIVRRTAHRAGLIKVATGGAAVSGRDRLLIDAAGLAHARTGAPVLTHCEHGTGGLEQVAALAQAGVPADAVILSHVDKVTDVGYHRELASSGAWLEYDQALRTAGQPEPATVVLIRTLESEQLAGRILLGTDGARRTLWTAFTGGPGLAWLARDFPGVLRAAGVSDDTVRALFTANPARALALRPI